MSNGNSKEGGEKTVKANKKPIKFKIPDRAIDKLIDLIVGILLILLEKLIK